MKTMKYPKAWKDVTINQYYNLLDVIDLPLSDEDKAVTIISALTDLDIEYLQSEVPLKELIKAMNNLKFIGNTKAEGSPKVSLKVGGKRITFDMILRDSSASSFISLSELTKNPDTIKKNLHNIIAVFCYECNWLGVRKERTVKSQKEIAELLKEHLNMNDAFLYRDFFLLSYDNLLKSTLSYLEVNQKKIAKELKKMTLQPS